MRASLCIQCVAWLSVAVVGFPDDRAISSNEISIPTGKAPKFVSIADINQDGKPDLIVANEESVSVLIGDGRGHFTATSGSPLLAGHLPNDIAVADMNHDGRLDLVLANHQSPYLTILLGDGKGGFKPGPGSPIDVHSHPHPHGVAVGAFSRKGRLDVVTDSWGTNQIELLENDGHGGLLTPGRFFRVGHRPYERLRAADFNKDGLLDVVTTNLDDNTVTVLLGDQNDGLREASGSPFPAGAKPWQIAIDDFNGDGDADLAIIPYERDTTSAGQVAVTILLGNGKGRFTPMRTSPLPLVDCRGPNGLATGDLNADGHRDIVVSCAENNVLAIFSGSASGVFTRSTRHWLGGWGSIAVGDLNGDGKDDVVTADENRGTITLYFSH